MKDTIDTLARSIEHDLNCALTEIPELRLIGADAHSRAEEKAQLLQRWADDETLGTAVREHARSWLRSLTGRFFP